MKLSLDLFGRNFTIGASKHSRKMPTPHGRMFRVAQVDAMTESWQITRSSADAEYLVSALQMRARHRQFDRDNGLFRRTMRIYQNNVMGHRGIPLEMKAKSPSGELLAMVNTKTKDAWERSGRQENCTVTKEMTRVQLLRLGARVFLRDGMGIFRKHRGFENAFGFALEPIEVDRLDHNYNKPIEYGGNRIKFGIERDTYGAPVAYHILKRHPGDTFSYSGSSVYRERVPAEDIITIWDYERAEQTIGYSPMCAMGPALHHLEEYIISENIAARQGADQGGWFVKKPEQTPENGWEGPKDASGATVIERETGSYEELPLGWDVKQNAPTHPTTAFGPFVKSVIRLMANAAGISYISAAGDYEAVNYSSWKAARLEDVDEYQWIQQLFIEKLMVPWFEEWLPFAILSGQLEVPMTMLDTIKRGAVWVPRVWKSVEPLKESQADQLDMQIGVRSRMEVIRDRGGDIEDVDTERKASKECAEKNGVEENFGNEPQSMPEEEEPPKKLAAAE